MAIVPEGRAGTSALRAAVVVPSFGRPHLLERCLSALERQRRPLDEVVVAARAGDDATVEVARAERSFTTRVVLVSSPGHLPPLAAGVAATDTEVVLFCDDDAEPDADWTAVLLRHFEDPSVGGAGGLVRQPGFEEDLVAEKVGLISRSGRFDRLNVHRMPATSGPRDVDVVRGTNMGFRRELLAAYPWDARLNRGAATDYEVDLCSWVRRRGLRIVFDPDAVVVHHVGPRPEIGRASTPASVRDYSHNLVYVSAKALPPSRRAVAVAAAFLVGSRASYGVATALADAVRGRPPSLSREVLPAFAGKAAGVASALAHARSGPVPLDTEPRATA